MATTAHGTLTANVVTTVTLGSSIRGWRIQHRGGSGDPDIWYTWGFGTATTPTVSGSGTYNLPGAGIDVEDDPGAVVRRLGSVPVETVVFKLLSTGAVDYSVETF